MSMLENFLENKEERERERWGDIYSNTEQSVCISYIEPFMFCSREETLHRMRYKAHNQNWFEVTRAGRHIMIDLMFSVLSAVAGQIPLPLLVADVDSSEWSHIWSRPYIFCKNQEAEQANRK